MVSRGGNSNLEYLSFTFYVHMLDNLPCFSIFPVHRFTVASSNVADRLIYMNFLLIFDLNSRQSKS